MSDVTPCSEGKSPEVVRQVCTNAPRRRESAWQRASAAEFECPTNPRPEKSRAVLRGIPAASAEPQGHKHCCRDQEPRQIETVACSRHRQIHCRNEREKGDEHHDLPQTGSRSMSRTRSDGSCSSNGNLRNHLMPTSLTLLHEPNTGASVDTGRASRASPRALDAPAVSWPRTVQSALAPKAMSKPAPLRARPTKRMPAHSRT
jgi:hypothetical protein